MRHNVRFILLSAVTLISANSFGADIQQVAARGCTDGGCGEACPVEGCCNAEGCNLSMNGGRMKAANCKPVGGKLSRKDRKQMQNADYCEPYDGKAGRCNMRTRWQAYGMNWAHRCGPIGQAARMHVPGARTLQWCCTTKGSGDSGWAPPARLPVNYDASGFAAYHRNAWYGTEGGGYGAGAPMVYQPTDTAQLGYSYANVPTWRRDPSKIPSVPYPSNYHARICPVDPRCGGGCVMGNCQGCMTGGEVMYGEVIEGSMCPTCEPGFTQVRPQMQPATRMVRTPAGQNLTKTLVSTNSTSTKSSAKTVSMPKTDASLQPATQPPLKVPQLQQTSLQTPQASQQRQPQPSRVAPATPNGNRPVQRSTNRRPQQRKKSGGWFGLPSLSEMTF